jgi:hypothetical protein
VRAGLRERFPPLVAGPARRKGCARLVRGGASSCRKGSANLHSSWSGPREETPLRRRGIARLVSPSPSPQGGGRGEGRERQSPPPAERGRGVAQVGARASHVLQKSVERPRAQRSVPPVAVRSKAWSIRGAREREPDRRTHPRRVSAGVFRR